MAPSMSVSLVVSWAIYFYYEFLPSSFFFWLSVATSNFRVVSWEIYFYEFLSVFLEDLPSFFFCRTHFFEFRFRLVGRHFFSEISGRFTWFLLGISPFIDLFVVFFVGEEGS